MHGSGPGYRMKALSIDGKLPAFSGKVHSIFNEVINIESDEGELITLSSKLSGCPNGPNTVLVPSLPPARVGEAAFYDGSGLRVGKNRVDTGEAGVWEGRMLKTADSVTSLTSATRDKIRRIVKKQRKGLMSIFHPEQDLLCRRVSTILPKLFESVKSKDAAKLDAAVSELVGLGYGLTPSCDDLLLGFTAALYHAGQQPAADGRMEFFVKNIKPILKSKRDKTTFLSWKMLDYGADCRFSERVLKLLGAVFSEEPCEEEIAELSNAGHTSGSDTLAGIILGASFASGLGFEGVRQ